MLTSADTIRALTTSKHLANKDVMKVLDPVMISTSGHTLLPDDAIEALKGLFEVVDWLTPNIPEAQRLAGVDKDVDGAKSLVELAKKTAESCNVPIVLLKGGHHPISRDQVRGLGEGYRVIYEEGDDEEDTIECLNLWRKSVLPDQDSDKVVLDILVQRGMDVPTLFVGKYVESSSTHGTGCTLSSAIAAAYAKLPADNRGESSQSLRICSELMIRGRSECSNRTPSYRIYSFSNIHSIPHGLRTWPFEPFPPHHPKSFATPDQVESTSFRLAPNTI